jgi:cytoplasmic iron level regulating protein YaaA (DUF328/UPF0246 family)
MDTFGQGLRTPRQEVLNEIGAFLSNHDDSELKKLVKVRGPLLVRARASFEALAHDEALFLPAWQRYNGVVWKHLEPATLSTPQRQSILVPSGLFGVTTANDDVADYRLKMDVVLRSLGLLNRFWRPWLSSEISSFVGDGIVVDLLPKEHAAAIALTQKKDVGEVVHARFLDSSGERAVGHDAKAVKGIIARLVLSEGLSSVASVRWRGWRVRVRKGEIEARAPRRT